MIFGINTTHDISKLSQISRAVRWVKLRITIWKYRSWYLCKKKTTNHAITYTNFYWINANFKNQYLSIVFYFSWNHYNTQEKLKTKVMQSFGRQTRCIMGDVQMANRIISGTSFYGAFISSLGNFRSDWDNEVPFYLCFFGLCQFPVFLSS